MHCLSYNIRNPHLNPVLFLPTKTYVDAADTQAHTHTTQHREFYCWATHLCSLMLYPLLVRLTPYAW